MIFDEDTLYVVRCAEDRFLFRVLRDEERPENDGIVAKDPSAAIGLTQHVENGSRLSHKSQYISCSKNFEAAIQIGLRNIEHYYSDHINIVLIDRTGLDNDKCVVIHDTSNGQGLVTQKAQHYAKNAKEVVIKGHVKRNHIVAILYIKPRACNSYITVERYIHNWWCMSKAGPIITIAQRPDMPSVRKTGTANITINIVTLHF
ncbi:uncharacterized protein LOC128209648 isoform X1 [Mya arenaria]|uniref:uncharacterized protein LOC128209648 isoform X1 n=1 Tax=Mya arenaria TaxID=6604 RepID=UPI0022E692F7|nr:uncharacterized protein LOC128209648 isoform X1 [Mya arenaria]